MGLRCLQVTALELAAEGPQLLKKAQKLCLRSCEAAGGCITMVSMHTVLHLAGKSIPGIRDVSELQKDYRSWAAKSPFSLVLGTEMVAAVGGVCHC